MSTLVTSLAREARWGKLVESSGQRQRVSGAHRRRYLSLVLDSLNPAQAHPLPSV